MAEEKKSANRLLLAVVALTALVVIAVAAYILWPRKPDHVFIVGDSVSFLSMPDIKAEFGEDTSIEPITIPGHTSTDLLPRTIAAIDEREASGAALDRAIFLVGYNDVMQRRMGQAQLEALVEQSARYDCVVWLTLPGRPGGEEVFGDVFPADDVDEWNQRTADLVGEHGNLHLVKDWEEAVNGGQPGEFVQPDGVHPNEAGQARLAEIMVDSIVRSCRFA